VKEHVWAQKHWQKRKYVFILPQPTENGRSNENKGNSRVNNQETKAVISNIKTGKN